MIILKRNPSTIEGTSGWLFAPGGFSCRTIELPWKDNRPFESCIPDGTYPVKCFKHPRRDWTYEIMDVPDRTDILIHGGNFAGDKSAGLKSDFAGCLGLGVSIVRWQEQMMLTDSKRTVLNFMRAMSREDFTIRIEWLDELTLKTPFGGR